MRPAYTRGNRLELLDCRVALEITFTMEKISGYRKLIDFSRREDDAGLYIYNGQLTFYQFGTGGSIRAGQSSLPRPSDPARRGSSGGRRSPGQGDCHR